MKRTKQLAILIILSTLTPCIKVNAQLDYIGTFLSSGTEDGKLLTEAYISPFLNAFGASMTGGWYNTAKPHALGGFDLTLTGNVAIIPSQYKTFDVDGLGLQSVVREPGTETTSPTIAGSTDFGPQMEYNYPDNNFNGINAYNLPQGTNVGMVPTPMIQLGLGLFKGTEIMGRFMPPLKYNDNKINMWGVGLKHSVSQWIPALKKIPVLNISVQGGYTKLNSSLGIHVKPEDVNLQTYNYNDLPATTWDNQSLEITSSSFTANLLVSADLPVVCFFGGVGFANTQTSIIMEGLYPMLTFENDVPVLASTEGFEMDVKNQDGGVTKPRLNAGMRLKLGVLTFQFDYTRANFNVLSFGMGISFR